MKRQPLSRVVGAVAAPFVVVTLILLPLIATPVVAAPITGTWTVRYADVNGDRFPARLARGFTFDQEPDGDATFRQIGLTGATPPFPALYTGLNGQLTATLDNFEAGGIDPALRMRTEAVLGGRDVEIYTSGEEQPDILFPLPGELYTSISDVLPNQNANFAATDDLPGNFNYIGGAFAVMDAFVTGMHYADYLGTRNSFLDVIYPSVSGGPLVIRATTMVGDTTQYRSFIPDAYAFNWDTLLHEYGHTVSRANNFDGTTGGPHVANELTNIFLAWSEGYATFHSSAAQDWENAQPGDARLPNVRVRVGAASPTIRSTIDQYIDDAENLQFSVETRKTYSTVTEPITRSPEALGPKNELAVTRILWDIYDGTGGSEGRKDEITLGHKGTYALLTPIVNPDDPVDRQHGPHTVREFEQNCAKFAGADNVLRAQFGAIFAEHGVAPKAIKARPAMGGGGGFVALAPGPDPFDLDPDYDDVPLADPSNPFIFDFFQLRSPPQDEPFEAYHIQFFRELPQLTPVIPRASDAGELDSNPGLFARSLILTLDMGVGESDGTNEELRYFQPTLFDWQTLMRLSGGTFVAPATIWWNVVGLLNVEDADGSWGNALRFMVNVPEPSTLVLVLFVAVFFAGLHCRGRSEN